MSWTTAGEDAHRHGHLGEGHADQKAAVLAGAPAPRRGAVGDVVPPRGLTSLLSHAVAVCGPASATAAPPAHVPGQWPNTNLARDLLDKARGMTQSTHRRPELATFAERLLHSGSSGTSGTRAGPG